MNFFAYVGSLIVFLLFMGCGSLNAQIKKVPIERFKMEKSKKHVLIDVRTPKEYEAGHLPRATNIDYLDKDFAALLADFNKNKRIYLYCKSGNRSAKASKILDSLGFKKIVNLDGGFTAWKETGKPIEVR